MKPILEIQNIGKKYKIQHQAGGYLSLRERMVNALKFEKNQVEDFWALKDVSFDVQPGESIGIIGRNGAGKSTLLKILSKITPPTTGKIISRGRIASLLEVGTGFHPELTGRENIFFNGSLLGMKRREIESKFDEIVDFSGVEKFLDTPLKHYSSGMQLRLAFAVAAFLEPEILIIDEVLAVGDAEFQKKCMGKMEDVSKSGRTILFVSHNLEAVSSLTKVTLLLNAGCVKTLGKTFDVIKEYGRYVGKKNAFYESVIEGFSKPKVISFKITTSLQNGVHIHLEPFLFEIEIYLPKPLENGAVSIQIFNQNHIAVTHFWLFDSESGILKNKTGTIRLQCYIPQFRLFLGNYYCTLYFSQHSGREMIETIKEICPFEVSMFGHTRDYEWSVGSSTYLDEFSWKLI